MSSTTIQYIGSGLKYLKNTTNIGNIDKHGQYQTYKMQEGIKVLFIISLASLIEGVIKTYLKSKVEDGLKIKRMIEKRIACKEKIDDKEKETIGLSAFFKDQELEVKNADKLMNKIIQLKIDNIENLSWENLKKEFKMISEHDFEELSNKHQSELSKSIEFIFKFRNLFIHGNIIDHKVTDNGTVEFLGKAKDLYAFIRKNSLEKESPQNADHFIEYIVTDKLVDFLFEKIYTNFIELPIWSKSFKTKNMINLIYRD
jgi:hypothetical protein